MTACWASGKCSWIPPGLESCQTAADAALTKIRASASWLLWYVIPFAYGTSSMVNVLPEMTK